MCFSATASFTAGALLLGFGVVTLKSAKRPRERLFAAIPLLFAIQQLSEGVIWLTFSADAPLLNTVMTHVYSFLSHVLWPIYLPVAVLMIEPPGGRRRALTALVVAGSAVGVYLLYVLVAFPVVSRATGQHVEYDSPHFFAAAVMMLYLISTTVSPLLSTLRGVRVFGAWRCCRSARLLLLCDVVHLGVVLFCGLAERRHLPSLYIATGRAPGLAKDFLNDQPT